MTSHTPGAVSGAGREADADPLRPPLTTRLRPWHWVAIDAVTAALLALVFVVGTTRPAHGIGVGVAYGLTLVSTLPAAFRRWWPLPVLGVVLAGSAAAVAIGSGKDPSLVVAFVLYTVALRYPRRLSAAALAGVLAVTAAGTAAGGAALGHERVSAAASHLVTSAAVIIAGWVVGVAVREQRAYTAGLREQAERRTQMQLAQARREVTRERLRIARELHDVVAHSLSLIAVQAGVGHYVARDRPEEAARALASIEGTSRGALREMRRLVGVLREADSAEPILEPAHGLADLGQLITGTADAGVRVQLEVRGAQRSVPPGVDLAAYRIVQEALTNVVKHARATASRVLVTYADDALCLEITDDGHGTQAPSVPAVGHGLAGMAERASLYGGEFHAGPGPARGFQVAARLPLDAAPEEPEGQAAS